MSTSRLPYYQQPTATDMQRGRGQRDAGYRERNAAHKGHRTRERERSRSRSRSMERHRRPGSRERRYQHYKRHHRDSHSRERSHGRERERTRRNYHKGGRSRSRSRSRSTSISERRHRSRIETAAHDSSSSSHKHAQAGTAASYNAVSAVGAYYNLEIDEPVDKDRIHREMEEKLRQTLAREGKVYPPPKTEAAHPVFANDGSFMELFKKMQKQQQGKPQPRAATPQLNMEPIEQARCQLAAAAVPETPPLASSNPYGVLPPIAANLASSAAAPFIAAAAAGKTAPPPPLVGRRRGGKILKTGLVAKVKATNERNVDPKDFWSLYLAEVNKYKSNSCDTDNGKRPLVK